MQPGGSNELKISRVTLEDKYALERGLAVATGTQALVLLMMMQRRRDRAAGLNTAGFCSGYRGSPLATLDQEFGRAAKFLAPLGIRFQGAVNEALAATSVWGSQLLALDPAAIVDGVFGMWFGKGAGLDQCVDVMRHANSAGTSALGGVLAVVGDDHALKSSAQPHHCEPTFADLRIPVLYPSNIQELLRFGLLGYALSRYSGSWVGLKTLPEVVNSTGVVDLQIGELPIKVPSEEDRARNRYIQWPDPWPAGEIRFHELKWPRILEFIRANEINRVVVRAAQPRLGIVTAGKSYLDVLEALALLGLAPRDAGMLGVSVYKLGCPWPVEPSGLLAFAADHPVLLVVEEKRAIIEDQVKAFLYDAGPDRRVAVFGRFGPDRRPLFASSGELSPETIALALAQLLPGAGSGHLEMRAEQLAARERELLRWRPAVARTPFFCSGCPHNTSTKIPAGSTAMAGIGCHGMAMLDPASRTTTHTHMGGEGATWIGLAPFTARRHVFQNMGEGTYHHSGSLAIRAAIAAGANITYKILFNDAVAMTGGQAIDGPLSVPQLAQELRHEGVERIAVVSDEPDGIAASELPARATIHHRDELDRVQRELRDIEGVTAIVYVQTCATEKRRRRKRGLMPAPDARIFINPAVCEGCGDCSTQSNCLSVVPIETELGRKRRIDQSACNLDRSCTKGFCPSFVTVTGAGLRKRGGAALELLAPRLAALAPNIVVDEGRAYNIVCAGIGGTGVVTVGALIAVAARLCGIAASVHDRLGMAQKFGAVTSHIRIARSADLIDSVRIPMGRADVVLGCDLMVAAQADVLRTIGPGSTRVIMNTDEAAPGAFVSNPDFDYRSADLLRNVQAAAMPGAIECLEATRLATALAGDTIATNMFMLGYALQRGLVPIPAEAIERAIELNGIAVQITQQTFALGRLAAQDLQAVRAAVNPALLDHERVAPLSDLDALIARRRDHLVAYQDEAYARRYLELVTRVRRREQAIFPGRKDLAAAAARCYFKVLAYKDEYEVARLYASPDFRRQLELEFSGPFKLGLQLAPPLLARRDPQSGEPRKMTLGPWVLGLFRVLARLKFLRGSRLDPFGYSADRKLERRLIREYEAIVERTMRDITPADYALAVGLLSIPEGIRGFGHVKERNYEKAMAEAGQLAERMSVVEHDAAA